MPKASFLPALICLVVMAGCLGAATTPEVTPTQPIKTICLPMVDYSQADQTEFAKEVTALDPVKDKQLLRFLGDYHAMREANRACSPG